MRSSELDQRFQAPFPRRAQAPFPRRAQAPFPRRAALPGGRSAGLRGDGAASIRATLSCRDREWCDRGRIDDKGALAALGCTLVHAQERLVVVAPGVLDLHQVEPDVVGPKCRRVLPTVAQIFPKQVSKWSDSHRDDEVMLA